MQKRLRSAAPDTRSMFEGFESSRVTVGDTAIFVRRKGAGRPLLLLHGFPQTHLMWHRVAPTLAQDFHVVCADLRGYGSSDAPASQPDPFPYSKRALAADMIQMMRALGFERFSVAGHDRGARVAYRMRSVRNIEPRRASISKSIAPIDKLGDASRVRCSCFGHEAAAWIPGTQTAAGR
jgi:alpha-beta hydrolase superfamily lysophospholipase